MKVYVDELPKSCAKCELCSHIFTNCLPNLYKCAVDGHARFAEYKVEDEEPCPLQSLAGHDKQVRKEVVQEIRNKLKQNGLLYAWKGEPKYKTMEELLDKIQGES